MTWLERSEALLAAAQKAKEAGDDVAFIALMVRAAECQRIAKNLSGGA